MYKNEFVFLILIVQESQPPFQSHPNFHDCPKMPPRVLRPQCLLWLQTLLFNPFWKMEKLASSGKRFENQPLQNFTPCLSLSLFHSLSLFLSLSLSLATAARFHQSTKERQRLTSACLSEKSVNRFLLTTSFLIFFAADMCVVFLCVFVGRLDLFVTVRRPLSIQISLKPIVDCKIRLDQRSVKGRQRWWCFAQYCKRKKRHARTREEATVNKLLSSHTSFVEQQQQASAIFFCFKNTHTHTNLYK